MEELNFIRYLESKRTVDDRSLSPRVLDALRKKLAPFPRVLELGCGTGAASHRLLTLGMGRVGHWTLLDQDEALVDEALRRCEPLLTREQESSGRIEGLVKPLGGPGVPQGVYDLVAAQAVLDLFDLETLLPWIRNLGRAGALFYFSLNFDGVSIWEPQIDRELDERISLAYHLSMDERVTDGQLSGDSRSGRHLFTQLPLSGFEILEAASSDWAVWPVKGHYQHDEAYFLECLLYFYQTSLTGRPEISQPELDFWLKTRRQQVEQGQAVFLAHQFDFLAQS